MNNVIRDRVLFFVGIIFGIFCGVIITLQYNKERNLENIKEIESTDYYTVRLWSIDSSENIKEHIKVALEDGLISKQEYNDIRDMSINEFKQNTDKERQSLINEINFNLSKD